MRLLSLTLLVQRTDLSEETTVADAQAAWFVASSWLDRASLNSRKAKFFYLLPERKILLIGCCLFKILPPFKKARRDRFSKLLVSND
ncbi:MAG: hypothetical protein HC895_20515 [Leptolyngbyaceae cyanobacterium SM1_3_5]|nr:hypothetical protein [Leptolyngbyaceae cyanobacterium SM1_3_5]